jgi:hypothetical protein
MIWAVDQMCGVLGYRIVHRTTGRVTEEFVVLTVLASQCEAVRERSMSHFGWGLGPQRTEQQLNSGRAEHGAEWVLASWHVPTLCILQLSCCAAVSCLAHKAPLDTQTIRNQLLTTSHSFISPHYGACSLHRTTSYFIIYMSYASISYQCTTATQAVTAAMVAAHKPHVTRQVTTPQTAAAPVQQFLVSPDAVSAGAAAVAPASPPCP